METTTICFHNEDIKKYIGKDVKEINVGDTLTITVKCKVKEVRQHKEYGLPTAVGEKEKTKNENKIRSSVDLEVTDGKEDQHKSMFKIYHARM